MVRKESSLSTACPPEFYDNFWKLIQQYLGDQIDIEKLTDEIQKEFEEGADQLLAENPDWK